MSEVETNLYFEVDRLRLEPAIIIDSTIEHDDYFQHNYETIKCATWEQAHWLVDHLQDMHAIIMFKEFVSALSKKG